MLPLKFWPLVFKHIIRHRTRSLLTIFGVATAMFLFYAVQAMQVGVAEATEQTAQDTTLVVYREDRFCPFTSRLPEDYGRKIAQIDGVRDVTPIKILVGNCRASIDVVTFRGVPRDAFDGERFEGLPIIAGSIEQWKRRGDAAVVGKRLAERRNLKVGDSLEVAGVSITVAGILDSDNPQDRDVAYTDLEFIQRARGNEDGIVTQFNVLVDSPERLDTVAAEIDQMFENAQEPTATFGEKEFVARATTDIMELIGFAGWLGWGALVAVFALVGNAIALSVRDRIRDHAVLQTLGYGGGLIGALIVAESLLVSLVGGALGLGVAAFFSRWQSMSFSMEGLSIAIQAGPEIIALGLVMCVAVGVLAGLLPAFQASRRSIVECFRAV